jgi:hypothetical protein
VNFRLQEQESTALPIISNTSQIAFELSNGDNCREQGLSPPISVCDDCGFRSRRLLKNPPCPKSLSPRLSESLRIPSPESALDRLKKNCLWAVTAYPTRWRGAAHTLGLGRKEFSPHHQSPKLR